MKSKISVACFLLTSFCLGSYTFAQNVPATQDYRVDQLPLPLQPAENASLEKLNGNWNLAGNREQKRYPLLSTSFALDGSWIIGVASYDIVCSHQIDRHFVSDNSVIIGKVASDGSFTLSPVSSFGSDGRILYPNSPPEQVEVLIKGVVPVNGARTWNGTYAFTIPPYKPLSSNTVGNCRSPQAGSFVASPYAPLTGTYRGFFSSPVLGHDVSVTVDASQSGPQPRPNPDGQPQIVPYPLFPLTATIGVSGSPCFTHGTSRAPVEGNQISGDRFRLNFEMDGGAILMVEGWVSGADSDTLRDVNLAVAGMGSKCFNADATGTLKKQ